MEKELNIAAILKEKSKGTKLWSPILGECKLRHITNFAEPIQVTTKSNENYCFRKDGRYVREGEIMLFPSKQMQDWSKFAWKKGDVLLCGVDNCCIFKGWDNDEYTEFDAEFVTPNYSGAILKTKDWSKVTREDTIKQYIAEIEEIKGGKLNLETLEIEHPKQEFKDGDIITIEDTEYKAIIIYKSNGDCMFRSYALIDNAHNQLGIDKIVNALGRCTRLATDSEKQQFFSALEKENKRWNPDTKTIEDLPKKCEFKPFDKVLVRDSQDDMWMPNFFSCYNRSKTDEYKYGCIAGNCDCVIYSKYCIPYNEETKHLLGATDDWKGGNNG